MSGNVWKATHEKQYTIRYNELQYPLRFTIRSGIPAAIAEAAAKCGMRETSLFRLAVDEKLAALGYPIAGIPTEKLILLCREAGYEPDAILLQHNRFYRSGALHIALIHQAVQHCEPRQRAEQRHFTFTTGSGECTRTTFIKIAMEDKLKALGITPIPISSKIH